MAELKPCPFCGGEAKMRKFASGRIFSRITVFFAECCVCRCKTSVELDTKTAEEAWNRRAENEELIFTRKFLHDHGLKFAALSAWERWKKDGK